MALEKLLDEENELDDCFVRLDYVSIAQKHEPLKQLAIAWLLLYATAAHKFFVIAPSAMHSDTNVACNPSTYKRRGSAALPFCAICPSCLEALCGSA
eukprot:2006254-Pleurochrysis_carterae.AAC.1